MREVVWLDGQGDDVHEDSGDQHPQKIAAWQASSQNPIIYFVDIRITAISHVLVVCSSNMKNTPMDWWFGQHKHVLHTKMRSAKQQRQRTKSLSIGTTHYKVFGPLGQFCTDVGYACQQGQVLLESKLWWMMRSGMLLDV
eukprot:4798305-Amphidinium_carterae.2